MCAALGIRLDLTSDPAAAASGLERFWAVAPAAVRNELNADRGLAQALVALLAGSEFLTEALLRYPDWLLWLAAERDRPSRAREEWAAALTSFTAGVSPAERSRSLARFKRREYLRIAFRDLDGRAELAETTRELSDLADGILQQAYVWSWNDLASQFGAPCAPGGAAAEMAVIALGKLGGGELNYSSDIDLVFAYSGEGRSAGAASSISNAEFFTRLAQQMVRYLSQMTPEGQPYRVDLRLRPAGREGELVPSLPQWQRYYAAEAREWEFQMLLRARGVAGAPALAARLLLSASARIYPPAPDQVRLAEGVRAAREAISAQLRHRRATGQRRAEIDVKLDPGGIRDIEFLTQYWQRLHGGREPWVRSGHTLLALQRLHDTRRISGSELQVLASAYLLLRHTEHRLQLRLGQQTHTLPARRDRLAALARSLHVPDASSLLADQMAAVRILYAHYLDAPISGSVVATSPRGPILRWPDIHFTPHGERQVRRLERSLATWPEEARLWETFSPALRRDTALLLESSDWAADILIRRPALARALDRPMPVPPSPSGHLTHDMVALRHWQQAETLRLLSEEWQHQRPIASTLAALTQLAEASLRAGLALAAASTPAAPSLAILGLGRLGLGELDLLSDVDVVFVASEDDREAAATLAARWIEVITAYTQAGTLYAVDARLRPGGREGELVQTPASLAHYFDHKAGLWEAVSYLKARPVAGDAATASLALASIQHALHRYRLRTPPAAWANLRDRIEHEGHPGSWGLKTVAGGYYDVDFHLARLMLNSATPHPGPTGLAGWARAVSAPELAELVTYLRAADHALRVATGKAGAAVPATGAAIDRAWSWLDRIHATVPPLLGHTPSATERPSSASSCAINHPERITMVRSRIRAIYQGA